MSPQVHTASSAYAGLGLTLVNVPTVEHARIRDTKEFIIGSIGRWLGLITSDELSKFLDAAGPGGVPKEILDSIESMENAGLKEQAAALRRKFVPLDFERVRDEVTNRIGFDPLEDEVRSGQLAANLDVYERILKLPRLTLDQLEVGARTGGRAITYANYRPVLARCGFDPSALFLVKEFPVTYLAVGYSRGGFGPKEADLVAYKERPGRGQAIKTLLYSHPTETEALVLGLDPSRVSRWLVINGAATEAELSEPGGVGRWFAARMGDYDGRLPPPWDPEREPDPEDAEYGPRKLFVLLHSVAHQVVRAMAVDSGFSETALSEYLFPYALSFAIHPNGGSEFTIGGLRTVLEQNLDEVLARGLDNDACIYDPNCMVANRGADHGCLQLPETACQAWNWFISRWELFGSPDGETVGYWSPRLDATPALH